MVTTNQNLVVSTNAIVTVNGSQAIEVRWHEVGVKELPVIVRWNYTISLKDNLDGKGKFNGIHIKKNKSYSRYVDCGTTYVCIGFKLE